MIGNSGPVFSTYSEGMGANAVTQADLDHEALISAPKNAILDRCWASHISAAGGMLGILGAREVMKGRYGRAAVFAGASALLDFADGIEARRFAKRNPEAGLARKNAGGWEDQIWDRVRNVALGVSVMTVDSVPPRAKAVVGAMVAKETVTGVVGLKTLADHWIQNKDGWPAPLPSADRGKESMWWVGSGLSGVMLAAKLESTNPELAKRVVDTATAFCGVGLLRGLQTVPEYTRVMSEMSELSAEEQTAYTPNYKPHVLGRMAQLHQGLRTRVQTLNEVQRQPNNAS